MTAVEESFSSPVQITTTGLINLNLKSRGLSLKSNHINSIQSGDYRSAFKGRGMEYDESRLYQVGDDIRNIDWCVTARTGKAHTKMFCEERERPVHLWIDFRSPMFFATRGRYKAVQAAELASLFGWTASRQGDRIGGIVFSDTEHHELKPQRGRAAVLRLIKYMVTHPYWQQPLPAKQSQQSMLHALLNLRRLVRPGSLIILLSDFRGFNQEIHSHLLRLHQHNEVIMVHIYDWLESSLPPAGQYRITDGEQELALDTGNSALLKQHATQFNSHLRQLRRTASSGKMNLLSCRTEDEPEDIIRRGLQSR